MDHELAQKQVKHEHVGDVIDLNDAVAIKERGEKLLEETKTLTLNSKALLERLDPTTVH